MDKFIEPAQSSYPFHVAVFGKTRGLVRAAKGAAVADAQAFGQQARVRSLTAQQARPYLEMDRQRAA